MTEITRGRQYELIDPPEPEPEPAETFGLMLRRPGDVANPDAELGADDEHEGIYLAPDFTERHDWWKARAGTDPRDSSRDDQWSLSLPHQCDEWSIWDGDRVDVLTAACRFRAELDAAIAAMEQSESAERVAALHTAISAADGERLLDLSQQMAVAYLEEKAITRGQFEELNAAWFDRMKRLDAPATTMEAADG